MLPRKSSPRPVLRLYKIADLWSTTGGSPAQAAEKAHRPSLRSIDSLQRTDDVRLRSSIFARLAYELFERPAKTNPRRETLDPRLA
jgi:hypothetical protein